MGKYLNILKRGERDISDRSDLSPAHAGAEADFGRFGRFGRGPHHFGHATLDALERRRPAYVDHDRWKQAITDGRRFLAQWAEKAAGLGWSADDLFGLPVVPDRPAPNYQRLSRYDQTGLAWLLQGRRVVALTENTAVIETAMGAVSYARRNNGKSWDAHPGPNLSNAEGEQ